MPPTTRVLGAAALGYLLGSIPSADIATRLATGGSVDLRATGSGNPGATNSMAVLGKKWGYGVLVADMLKSATACMAGRAVAGDVGTQVAGTAAVVGHCFPVWSGFQGGKGVACAGAQFALTMPVPMLPDIALAGASMLLPREGRGRRFIEIACVGAVASSFVWWRKGWPNLWGPKPTAMLPATALASTSVILYRFAKARRPE